MEKKQIIDRDWWVYSTVTRDVLLLLVCHKTGAVGIVRNPTKQEWAEAFHAPGNPYRWLDTERVEITREGDDVLPPQTDNDPPF